MNLKKRILVLGGGADQIDLIEDLKQRGYETILVDYYPNPIAKSHADLHIQQSTLDKETVLRLARELEVENIITACTDQALLTVAYVANELGFPTQFSYDQALSLTNKLRMKEVMWKAGIPTSKYVKISNIDQGVGNLQYPLMVKPADCNGSYGVRKANNPGELDGFFDFASKASRTGQVIVEEFKPGKEVTVDCYVDAHGHAEILMLSEIRKKKIGENILLIFQSRTPAVISAAAVGEIERIANMVARNFNLRSTPLLMQTLVENDSVNVIEFAPRLGGGSKHRTITRHTGVKILHVNVDNVLGQTPQLTRTPNPNLLSRSHVYTYPSTLDHFENVEALINDGTIVEFVAYKTRGMQTSDSWASRERVGSFLVEAPTENELEQKIAKAVRTLKVIDATGKDVFNRTIFEDCNTF